MRSIRLVSIGLALVLAIGAPAVAPGEASATHTCTVDAGTPHNYGIEIRGRGYTVCNFAIDRIILSVSLDKWHSGLGQWLHVKTVSQTVYNIQSHGLSVYIPCGPGKYRTRAKADVFDNNHGWLVTDVSASATIGC